MNSEVLGLYITLFFLGCLAGGFSFWIFNRIKLGSYQNIATDIIHKGELEVERLQKNGEIELKQKQIEQQSKFEQIRQTDRQKIHKEESRLKEREDKLETRMNLVEKKLSQIEKREAVLEARKQQMEEDRKQLSVNQERLLRELETVSSLTATEAKEMLIDKLSEDVKTDAANVIQRVKKETKENAEREAGKIIATALNRLAVPCVSEVTVNTIFLPSDEMKGRIIGREGRNIRALERATGVNFIIDDTPGAVVLSGFDPIRLHIAKTALTELVMDGRIHPTRIEEAVEKAKETISKKIKQHGENAALRAGQMNLHPELINLLGRLKFRYSYGQNILDHSLEVSHLMGIIAAELHLDVRLAKRIGLLHDIGKAVSHEVEGTHAIIGHDLALKYGESKEVSNGIGCHHEEMKPSTVEATFSNAADALS
ncbi:MAG: ribonuclease Y, partial [Waddliaceae bacterium]